MPSFRYTSLGDDGIRIIELRPGAGIDRVQCSLKIISITSPTPEPYSALSYTWGLSSQLRSSIYLDDEEFRVRRNMFEAMQQLRYPDRHRRLWIDAICINQEDNDEKKIQIPLMSLIYSRAETVEIWLGSGEDNGELGLRSLASGELEGIATAKIVLAIIDLLQRPWFSRVWTIQELILSARDAAYVNCGKCRVTWEAFAAGINELFNTNGLNGAFLRRLAPQSLHNWLSSVILNHGGSITNLCRLRTAYCDWRAAESKSKPEPTAMVGTFYRNFRYASATISKDKIFGLCGLLPASAVDELIKSYDKTVEEVFFAATLYILQRDKKPNLYHDFPTISLSRCKKSKVPSWTLDLSFTGITYAELRFPKFEATREPHDKLAFSSDGRQMTINVCVMDSIARVLNPKIVVREPNNPNAWQGYALRFCEAAGIPTTAKNIGWQDRDDVKKFADQVNLISFLEEAHELYQQLLSCPVGMNATASFWETLLSGVDVDYGKGCGVELPTGSQLTEQCDILLGRRDTPIVAPIIPSRTQIIAQALTLSNPQAASAVAARADLAANLYGAVECVLAPAGCSVRSGFYVTYKGLCGLCFPEAREGDVIARLFRGTQFEIPAVLRPEEGSRYSMVCVASVSKGWAVVCGAEGVVDPEQVVLV